MDHQRFDELTRSLAGSASRRGVLRLLAGSALGGVLGLLGLEEAAAACRLAGQRCDADHRCCAGGACAGGRCRCKEGQNFFACDGPGTRCVNIATSETHCGGCGNPSCGPDQICLNGGCVNTCEDGLQDGLETDIDCGGPLCLPCANGKRCQGDADCTSDICEGDGTCQEIHSCSDGVKNGSETDIDCGGPGCPGCAEGLGCFIDGDCANRFCDNGVCGQRAQCTNGVKDGGETDIDCGGPDCPPCGEGQKCNDRDDCSGILSCVNRAGDGSDKKFCVECTNDDTCVALYATSSTCVNYFCRELIGTCNAGQDLCVVGINNTSRCQCGVCRTTTEGAITCINGNAGDIVCPANPCTSSAQCVNRYGPGAVCAQDTGGFCTCNACVIPC